MSSYRLAAACAMMLPGMLHAAAPLQDGPWELHCAQQQLQLVCAYWAVTAEAPARPTARALLPEAQVSLGVETTAFTGVQGRTAILFLVDTSDPRRKNVVAENAQQIQRLIVDAPAHQAFGLAAFDKGLKLLAPIGTKRSQSLTAARDALKAEGKVTELYRSALEGLALLEDFDADRKALVLLSDGLAEDTAYSLQDVVSSARAARVVIIGLGYARSSAHAVGLQSLRRLAAETGGYFVEAGADARLPEDFMKAPFTHLERGGGLTLDLEEAVSAGASGETRLRILLEPAQFLVPVLLPPPVPAPMPASETPMPPPLATPPRSYEPPAAPLFPMVAWLPALLVLLLVLVLLRRRERVRIPAPFIPASTAKPLAWLEHREVEDPEEDAQSHPITGSPWRIGRAPNNDLILKGGSISRHHAEIVYTGAGRFLISDMGAVNGIFVNEEKVKEQVLNSGDQIGIGEYRLCFLLNDPKETEFQEQTIIAHTRLPAAEPK